MVYLLIAGRAGNQFFQYAMARTIQKKYGGELAIDFSIIEGIDGYENMLSFYSTVEYRNEKIRDKFPIRWKLLRLIDQIRPKSTGVVCYIYDIVVSFLMNLVSIVYYKNTYKSKKFFKGLCHDYIILGWFESLKFFEEIDDLIKDELLLKTDYQSEKDAKLKEYLKETQSICISVRRGAFVSDCNLQKRFFICDEHYFYNAIALLANKIKNPVIYVCSDDMQWCRENFRCPYETIYEPDGLCIYEKLDIMKECHHFVVSNSTFSWWAQHLGHSQDKMVVAPKIWRNDKLKPIDIFEDNWIYLETDTE